MSVPRAALPALLLHLLPSPQLMEGKGGRGGRVTVGGEGPPIPGNYHISVSRCVNLGGQWRGPVRQGDARLL